MVHLPQIYDEVPKMQMMGHSDGFTLVKGISSYGLTKLRKKAGVDIISEVTQSNFNKSKMQYMPPEPFNNTSTTSNAAHDQQAFSKFPKIKQQRQFL